MITLILLITLTIQVNCQTIRISKVTQEIKIFKTDSVNLIERYDTLLHLINLTQCKSLTEQLEIQINAKTQPNNILREEINTLKIKIDSIIPHHIIHERGLINIAGTGFKYLYGLLDDNDKQEITTRLDNLEDNAKRITDNNNKQLVINTQFNEQFKQIKDIFDQSNYNLNNNDKLNRDIREIKNEIELNKNFQKLYRTIEKINDVLLTSRSGMLTQDILSAKEMIDFELNSNKLKELKIVIATYNDNLLIIIKIPSFTKQVYDIINIETFPISNQIIVTRNKKIIQYKQFLYEMTNDDQ